MNSGWTLWPGGSRKPFVAIFGDAKISAKIGIIDHFLERSRAILVGGGMATTFLRAKDLETGDSLVEKEVNHAAA